MNSLIYSSHAHREKHVRPPISRAAHTTPAQRPADRPAQHGLHPHTPRVASSRPSRPLKHSAGRGRGNHVAPRPPGSRLLPFCPSVRLPPAPCLGQYAAQQARPVPARLATRPCAPMPICPYALTALRTRLPCTRPACPARLAAFVPAIVCAAHPGQISSSAGVPPRAALCGSCAAVSAALALLGNDSRALPIGPVLSLALLPVDSNAPTAFCCVLI